MKRAYDPNTQFFVTFTVHERDENYEPFVIETIENETLGLYDFLKEKFEKGECTSEGEIALELLKSLCHLRGDNLKYKMISIINWWSL